MRVLVTGGAGYIGSITARLLLDAGHDVVVLDSLERGHVAAVDQRAWFVHSGLDAPAVLAQVVSGVNVVIHIAGYIDTAESQANPALYFQKNLIEPSVMLDRMIAYGARRIVYSSTAAVYGEPSTVPITEEAPTRPVNAYGDSKLAFERVIAAGRKAGALESVVFRYFNVAGAMPDGSLGEAHDPETHIVPRLIAAARGPEPRFTVYGHDYATPDGTCIRDYVHVVDLAIAHLAAVEYLAAGEASVTLNLGSGRGYSNLEVVRACESVTGKSIAVDFGPRRDGDPAVLTASNGRAREVLGWKPERDLNTMVADAWRWHRLHPHGYEQATEGV